jgi:acyl dehydratase
MHFSLEEIVIGQKVEQEFTIDAEMLDSFIKLTGDTAPVHVDEVAARSLGFPRPIVHGLLVTSLYSSLLGMKLPGPRTVIMKLSTDMLQPVFVGDVLLVSVVVSRVSAAAQAVMLELGARRGNEMVNRGSATCLFKG